MDADKYMVDLPALFGNNPRPVLEINMGGNLWDLSWGQFSDLIVSRCQSTVPMLAKV